MLHFARFHMDPTWSETGDRYMLKLFRDYLFHQVDENGAPWIDLAHITQCLNKVRIPFHINFIPDRPTYKNITRLQALKVSDEYILILQLDSGLPEKMCLMSRDEQSVLVVSYAELKQCFMAAFSELLQSSQQSSGPPPPGGYS